MTTLIVQERYTDGHRNQTAEYEMRAGEQWGDTLRRTRYSRHHTVFEVAGREADVLLVDVYPATHRIAVSIAQY